MVVLQLTADAAESFYGDYQTKGFGRSSLAGLARLYPQRSVALLSMLVRVFSERSIRNSGIANHSDIDVPGLNVVLFKKLWSSKNEVPKGLEINCFVDFIIGSFNYGTDKQKVTTRHWSPNFWRPRRLTL